MLEPLLALLVGALDLLEVLLLLGHGAGLLGVHRVGADVLVQLSGECDACAGSEAWQA